MPTWLINLIGALVIAVVVFGTGMKTMSMLDAGLIAKQKATIVAEQSVVKQVTAVTTQITKSDQAAETAAQTQLAGQATVITKEVTRYVSTSPKPPVGCVTNGMLRLHDAAVLGVDPSTIVPPAGQLDSACSTVAPSDFMAAVVGNYAAARANAEQLDALSADIKSRSAAVASAAKPE
jgi:hypothetical protein